jgi:hypothetical protein
MYLHKDPSSNNNLEFPAAVSLSLNTRAIQKVTSGSLLTKQAMRKKLLSTKNTYILKLFLNVVTAGIEAPVVWRNKFLYASVKEVYSL